MRLPAVLSTRALAIWLAVGVCISVAALIGFGYRATREWRRSSVLLVERRSEEAADLLATALARDMRAVQRSVLVSGEWDRAMLDPPYHIAHVVAGAFARYPYPDAFVAARGRWTAESIVFLTRSDRPPAWVTPDTRSNRFPVSIQLQPSVGGVIVDHIASDSRARRRFSIFDVDVLGTPYQVVARLIYADQLRERLDGVFGFMVNMAWARRHYFPDLTREIGRIGPATSGLTLSLVDERGRRVSSTPSVGGAGSISRRSFPLMFFDPLLVAVDQPTDVSRQEWTVEVTGGTDPTLASAISGSNWSLMVSALAGAVLAFGMVMTVRAVQARADLAELRSEFVASVTHELKTPIAAIRAAGDTLVSGRIPSSTARREYAQMVVQEAKRLTRLVDNLLALSRITDVTEVYSFEPLALDALVARAMQDFDHQFREAGFETQVDVSTDLPLIHADRTAMTLLIDNLIDNAIRYSPATRSLIVSAHRRDDAVVLDVADRGRGIPADEIALVTRKFFRGRHLVSNGSGLGLAIVKRVVSDHGGRLAIRSAVGAGTTVSVTLPIARDDEEADSRH